HPAAQGMPGHAEPGLEVAELPLTERPGGMNDGALPSRHGIDGRRIEVALLPVGRMIGALAGPPQTDIQRQVGSRLPIILKVEAMNPVSRQPSSGVTRESSLAYSAQHEAGEIVAGIGNRLTGGLQAGGHLVELKHAARLPELPEVCAEIQKLVP